MFYLVQTLSGCCENGLQRGKYFHIFKRIKHDKNVTISIHQCYMYNTRDHSISINTVEYFISGRMKILNDINLKDGTEIRPW